jgi:flagellar hook protein FlgE
MLDSIYIGMSGLIGYSKGLRVIANNTANINTPGFKGASLQFGDLLYSNGSAGGSADAGGQRVGQGLTTYATSLDFSQGELRQTGNDLDLAVDGQGLFMLRDESGNVRYTRDGEFSFNDEGVLLSRSSGGKVLARDESGALVEVKLDGLRSSAAKATETITLRGNLSSTATEHSLSGVSVIDGVGAKHDLTVEFKRPDNATSETWSVVIKDGDTEVGKGELKFVGGQLDKDSSQLSFTYKPKGVDAMKLSLSFGDDVTSFASGSSSTLAVVKQDGYPAGTLTKLTFDTDGTLNLAYSNGQTQKGVQLALARFDSTTAVAAAGDNLFDATDPQQWEQGVANQGAFGSVRSGVVEISNVDLSSEFSDLVIMQRGYQASSQVVSTANEMIQELFSLKGR